MTVNSRVLSLFINVDNTPISQSFTVKVFTEDDLRRPALIESDYRYVIYHFVFLFLFYITSASFLSVRFGFGLLF
jgi:hypothetical protein